LFYLCFVGNNSKSSKRRKKGRRGSKTAKTNENRQKEAKPEGNGHRASNVDRATWHDRATPPSRRLLGFYLRLRSGVCLGGRTGLARTSLC